MTNHSLEALEKWHAEQSAAYEKLAAENKDPDETPRFSRAYGEGNQLRSRALGCHTSQVQNFRDEARKYGITGVDWDAKTGDALFSSKGARKRHMKSRDVHDQDGGYGDG